MPISAFDLDRTLFRKNSSVEFGRYLYAKKLLPSYSLLFVFFCHALHVGGVISIAQLHKCAFRILFKGLSADNVARWVDNFLLEHFEENLYPPAFDKLREAQQNRHLTALLSSSPDFIVEPIAKRLGIPIWKATVYAVDKDRHFCHIAALMLGEEKGIALTKMQEQRGEYKQDITAYSDSYSDLPFLLAAGKAVGVNPDRKLRSFCRQNQWPII